MLEILRRIVQEVNAAGDLDQVLAIIVRQIKEAMVVDVASVYLADFEHDQHVLMLSEGLKVAENATIRLTRDEGLVGLVAQRAEPVNVGVGSKHPNYKHIPDIGEEPFQAFLGVPIIHQRKVLGVLVVQRAVKRRFGDDSVAFLVTLAAQLAGAISHAEAIGRGPSMDKLQYSSEYFVSGIPSAPGVGIGTAVAVYSPADISAVPNRVVANVQKEIGLFKKAVSAATKEMNAIRTRLKKLIPAAESALFDAYVLILESDVLIQGTIERIEAGSWAQGAVRDTILEHARKFEEMDDPYLRERAEDIREIGMRLIMHLRKSGKGARTFPRKTVLVGEEIGATQLAEIPFKRIAGVVAVKGSSSSHVAILARAMGIPTVMGASDMSPQRLDGQQVIVDGYQGRVYVDPSPPIQREYGRLAREESQLTEELKTLHDLPSQTPDGYMLPLFVNTGLLADTRPALRSGADGIGLYRTELPFMIRERFPSELEQRDIYRRVLKTFAPRPVTLRTLDVGGDKTLPYFPLQEDNPFLGWRGIRITLDHPEIFLTQLRAMLRAAIGFENLNLLLPMISDMSELQESVVLLQQAYSELLDEGEPVTWPKVGAMIEVPSAVYQSSSLLRIADFLSIGTNDLTQYLLAVDRNNTRVAKLYNTLHPSVLRAILQVVEAGREHNKPVSVCGEMAGDPAAAILLLGMGITSMSMASASLPRVKWVVRTFTRRRARNLLKQALQMDAADEIRALLNRALEKAGLGGLVRAGF